jgi:transcriptional repressor NrdR
MSDAFACPECGGRPTLVRDSRANARPVANVRRRRECSACGNRFTTFEVIKIGDLDNMVDLTTLRPRDRSAIRRLASALAPHKASPAHV